MKSFYEQFKQCKREGLLQSLTKQFSYKTFKGFKPLRVKFSRQATENQKREVLNDIKNETGEFKGIDFIKCGRFGGVCHSGKKKCQEFRKTK